jgi:hypothetical protein
MSVRDEEAQLTNDEFVKKEGHEQSYSKLVIFFVLDRL